MDAPATAMSERDLGMAVEENLFALFRAMADAFPGAEIEEARAASRHHVSPLNPMFKGVWGLAGGVGEAHAAAVDGIEWLRARGAPFGFVWLGPSSPREDLGARLAGSGFAEFEHEAPGMAARLDDLDWSAAERVPPGVTIGRAADEAGVRGFAQAFVASYDVPELVADAWVDATLAVGIDRAPWSFHVARRDGRPVACAIVFCGAGVGSVFGVGTIPDARGRGIGAAITLSAYAEARELGYRYGVLFATDEGLPVYRRLGFRETGTAVSRHLWWPGDA